MQSAVTPLPDTVDRTRPYRTQYPLPEAWRLLRLTLPAKPRATPPTARKGSPSPAAILDLPRGGRYRAKEMSALSPAPQPALPSGPVAETPGVAATTRPLGPQPLLSQYYDALFAVHGPQHWWPGGTPFEIIIGAILTQNTSWTNVERAMEGLRRERLLTPRAIESVSPLRLACLIRSSGYFRQKAKKLKAFAAFLRAEYHGSLAKMFRTPTPILRAQLLTIHGIGPETADCILLYAGKRPIFVVDAYTRRLLERHGLADRKHSYEEIRQLFERSVPADVALYNEFHALIVQSGKHYCRARDPRCDECALNHLLPERSAAPQ
jgi:endonuclease-3 related protein